MESNDLFHGITVPRASSC